MNIRKSLESLIRGWLPKEPLRPNVQDTNIAPLKGESEKQGGKKIGQITFVTFLVGGILLGIFSAMGLGLYAAVVIGVAMPLVIAVAARRLNPRQRGAKEVMTVGQRKGTNSILIFNVAISGLYLALYFVIVLILGNAEIALIIVIALLVTWFLVNRLLLRNLRKQASTIMERKV